MRSPKSTISCGLYGNKIYYICIADDGEVCPPPNNALTGLAVFPVAVLAEVRFPKSIAFPVDAMVMY